MNKMSDKRVTFYEVQRFRQKWLLAFLYAISLSIIIVFGYGMIKQLVFGHPWGSRPMPDTGLVIVGPLMILLGIGISWLFHAMKLVTEVQEDGISINYFPLTWQKILFRDIVTCQALTYNPILDYGGWGIRYGWKKKAYNVSGNRGVQLELANGKRLMIGSQRPEELAKAIKSGLNG